MVAQAISQSISATSDNVGNIEFDLPFLGARNLTVRYTVAIPEAGPGAKFIALVGGTFPRWGPWFGPQPFGPLTHAGNITTTVTGSGLQVSTTYAMEILGFADDVGSVVSQSVQPTGTTALVGSDEIFTTGPAASHIVGANSSALVPAAGLFPTAGYSSLRLWLQNLGTVNALQADLTWLDESQTAVIGSRRFVVGPTTATKEGSFLQVAQPHLGDFLRIRLTNGPAANDASYQIYLEQSTQPYQVWGNAETLTGGQQIPVGAAATVVLASPLYVFGGPAHIDFNSGTIGTAAYVAAVQYMDLTGTWKNLVLRSQVSAGQQWGVDFVAPPQPLRFVITNGPTPGTVDCSLTYDLTRVG